jgi:hypothetical protein
MDTYTEDGRKSELTNATPRMSALSNLFKRAMESQGIRTNGATEVDEWIEAVGGFSAPVHQVTMFPIGSAWVPDSQAQMKEVGRLMQQNMERLSMSMKPVLRHLGLSAQQVDNLVEGQLQELRNPSIRAYKRYHTVWAIKD